MPGNVFDEVYVHPLSKVTTSDVPSSLELLEIPFAFSQKRLLVASNFVSEARKRGFNLCRDRLEMLHRSKLLIPMFRIHSQTVGPSIDRLPKQQFPGQSWELYSASDQGRLLDPSTSPYSPWPSPRSYHAIYYSSFQLLTLSQMAHTLRGFTARRDNGHYKWKLPSFSTEDLETAQRIRALVIALEVLSPRYTPRVLGRLLSRGSSESIRAYSWASPDVERNLLSRVDSSLLLEQADLLLFRAKHIDPLGDWYRVIRLGAPRRWESLKFDALSAVELRIAAEMLILFYEDLADLGCAEPLSDDRTIVYNPRESRLRTDYVERSKALRAFRLENLPAVYLVVEGDTEMETVPRVLDLFGVGPTSGLVQLINLRNVDGDVALVARSVAVPRLHPEHPNRALLLRPLAALMIAVDPEGNYRTQEHVERQYRKVVDGILQAVPQGFDIDIIRSQVEQIVSVTTWGQYRFEFANFTDEELAQGILQLAKDLPDNASCKVPDYTTIVEDLADGRGVGKDIATVWGRWGCRFSKVKFAQLLWPILRAKLTDNDPLMVPVGQLVESIVELADRVRPVTHVATGDEAS